MAVKGWLREQLEHSRRMTAHWPKWRRDAIAGIQPVLKEYYATEEEHKVLANTLRELRLSKNNHY